MHFRYIRLIRDVHVLSHFAPPTLYNEDWTIYSKINISVYCKNNLKEKKHLVQCAFEKHTLYFYCFKTNIQTILIIAHPYLTNVWATIS